MRGRAAGERGQSAVELVLIFPLIALVVLAVVQAGLVVRDHVLVGHATREAVRVASVDDDPAAPEVGAIESSPLDPDRLEVWVGPRGESGSRVTVQVRYRSVTDVPLIGPLIGDVDIEAEATMRVE
jgi:hypothetical protein